ncbi:GNAT family N-acetyltransferase [Streptococcus oralis]|uniref:GNAT family N-acetyltransferase n=1 Tax=Streptococcus oralis TaxID=1303 RepID=UPI002001D322|nr:GNAT family N-acetyltransferase [Streptococcus oralis]
MTRAELPERIETERLVLRVRTVADAEDIHAYASLPEVSYPVGFPPVKTLEDEIYYLEHILPERNQKENLPAGYNVQSQRVAEKLGFTLEARIRDRKDVQGNRCDSLIYGLLKSEWRVK